MVDHMEKGTEEACVATCDKDFISCVESGSQDCLERFNDCSSTCNE